LSQVPNINPTTVRDSLRNSQKHFYAIDLSETEVDLVAGGEEAFIKKYHIKEAEKDGTLEHSASTYIMENDDLVAGNSGSGPKVVDFANILKYNFLPLAETLQLLLKLFKEAMGSPVEIEYAIDLDSKENGLPGFYLLQIKPLIRVEQQVDIDLGEIDDENVFMYAERGMGNGIIDTLKDIVYVDPEYFDKVKTRQMASEITKINRYFEASEKEYLLIGPGRWGSQDPFTGIPVLVVKYIKGTCDCGNGTAQFSAGCLTGISFFS
jgi:hypothetical protein